MQINCQKFCFNPFYQNTYLLYRNREALLIDAGMSTASEEKAVEDFLRQNQLHLTHVLVTHAHLDHVFGLPFLFLHHGLRPYMHPIDEATLQMVPQYAPLYNSHFSTPEGMLPPHYLSAPGTISWSGLQIEVLFLPGHAPGHVGFVIHEMQAVFSGDVLFRNSIGRTDLPGANEQTLLTSITQTLYQLPDHYAVFTGHGNNTTIGEEKANNPFTQHYEKQ